MPKPMKTASKKEKGVNTVSPKKTEKSLEGTVENVAKSKMKSYNLLRGFRDILPEDQTYWDQVRDRARQLAEYYSFGSIEVPVLEEADLFTRGIGKNTAIVEKEMYVFEDPGGNKVGIRPEFTAGMVRAYISHGMLNRPQPVKLFAMGPLLRHDRPQAGRYRQFYQCDFESIGSEEPIVDAQLMVIANAFFKDLGINVVMKVNSIGSPESRREYLVELTSYFRQFRKQFTDDDKRRLQKNPLRLLDSKEEYMPELLDSAPQMIDWLDEKSKEHFMKVLEYLEEIQVPYRLDPYLVRGLDYYNRTVFEIVAEEEEGEKRHQIALGGGGRFDGLVELLGGREGTPACGFALGLDRVVSLLKERQIELAPRFKGAVFFAQLGEAARRIGLKLFEEFRAEKIPVVEAFGKGSLKAQLELASKQEVAYTLILGQKEVLDGTVIVRDMDAGTQETVPVEKVVAMVRRLLGRGDV